MKRIAFLFLLVFLGVALFLMGTIMAQVPDPEDFSTPKPGRFLNPLPKPNFPAMICNKTVKFYIPPWWMGGVDLVFRTLRYNPNSNTLKYVVSNLRADNFSGTAVVWLLRKRMGQDPQDTATTLIDSDGVEWVQLVAGTTIVDVPGAGAHPEENSSVITQPLPQEILGWIDVQYINNGPESNSANNTCKIIFPFPQ